MAREKLIAYHLGLWHFRLLYVDYFVADIAVSLPKHSKVQDYVHLAPAAFRYFYVLHINHSKIICLKTVTAKLIDHSPSDRPKFFLHPLRLLVSKVCAHETTHIEIFCVIRLHETKHL